MSLRVWLPLTKDLRNQGLASLTSSGTPVFKNNGKLASKSLDLKTQISFNCPAMANKTIFSIAFWAKVNADSSLTGNWVDVIGFTDVSTSGANGQLRWETCYGSTSYRGSTYNQAWNISSHDNAIYAIAQVSSNPIQEDKGKWHHYVFTTNGVQAIEYRDGIVYANYTGNGGHLNGSFWCGQTNAINGEIQDVRIYDHCLSPMEVKQLSQGLILHYPLNRQGFGQENLLLNSNDLTLWPIESSGKIELQEDGYFKVSSKASNTTRYGIYYDFTFPEPNTYTFSVDVRDDWLIGVAPASTFTWTTANLSGTQGKKRISYTCTSTEENNKCRIYIAGTGTGGRVTYLKHPKLEKGSIATPWCPNSSDALATAMGLNGTTEYDTSGYCNNGTRTGTFSWTSDTPKYAVSTKFNGSECILRDSPNADIYTLACWAKTSKSKNTSQFMVADSNSKLSISFYNGNIISYFYGNSAGTGSKCTLGTEYKENEWNFFAVVKTGENTRDCYCNGVKLTPTSNDWWSTAAGFFVGNRSSGGNGPFYGEICDVRAYATPLSADDVKSLYQNSAYIDSSGNVYGTIHES